MDKFLETLVQIGAGSAEAEGRLTPNKGLQSMNLIMHTILTKNICYTITIYIL